MWAVWSYGHHATGERAIFHWALWAWLTKSNGHYFCTLAPLSGNTGSCGLTLRQEQRPPCPLSAPPMQSQYFNGRRIFQWQLLAEQSSRGGLDRARQAATVCVCVCACVRACVHICQSAGVCGEDFFSLLSSPFRHVNGVVIWLARGKNEGLGSHGC